MEEGAPVPQLAHTVTGGITREAMWLAEPRGCAGAKPVYHITGGDT